MNIKLFGAGTAKDFDTTSNFIYFLHMLDINAINIHDYMTEDIWENGVWAFCDRYFKDKVRELEDI